MSYAPNPALVQTQGQPMMRPANGSGGSWAYYPMAQQQSAAIRQYHQQQMIQSRPTETPVQEEPTPAAESRLAKRPPVSSKGLFLKDLKEIMFGLGDEAPAPDTVALMEDILVEYLHEMITSAGQGVGKTIQADDVRRALQGPGDERKLARLEELILLQVEIKKARAINGLEAGGRNLAD